jgi:putative MATE family efflux protein
MHEHAYASLNGPIRPVLIQLSLPMLLGMSAIGVLGVAEAYFVAKLGTKALVAFSFAVPLSMILGNLVIGFGVGLTTLISHAVGARRTDQVARLTLDAGLLALMMTIALAVLARVGAAPLFKLLNPSMEAVELLDQYIGIWAFALLPQGVVYLGTSALRGAGETRSSGKLLVLSSLLCLALDPMLIFGLGPLPALGLRGAALATLIAHSLTALLTVRRLTSQRMLSAALPNASVLMRSARTVLPVSLPGMLTYGLVPLGVLLATWLVSQHGEAAVAAIGVVGRIQNLCIILPLAVGAGLSPFVGINWAAGKVARVHEGLRVSSGVAVGCGLLCWALLGGFSHAFARMFSRDPGVWDVLRLSLQVLPASYAAIGGASVIGAMFLGIGQAQRAALLTFLRCIGLTAPLGWLGGQVGGVFGVLCGLVLGNLFSAVLAVYWSKRVLEPRLAAAEPAVLGA